MKKTGTWTAATVATAAGLCVGSACADTCDFAMMTGAGAHAQAKVCENKPLRTT